MGSAAELSTYKAFEICCNWWSLSRHIINNQILRCSSQQVLAACAGKWAWPSSSARNAFHLSYIYIYYILNFAISFFHDLNSSEKTRDMYQGNSKGIYMRWLEQHINIIQNEMQLYIMKGLWWKWERQRNINDTCIIYTYN